MHATFALALTGLLATASASGDHHATRPPRPPEYFPGTRTLPVPPRFTQVDWAVGLPEGPFGCQIPPNHCEPEVRAALDDPKHAMIRSELKSLTSDTVQRLARDVLIQYMQVHKKTTDCMLSGEELVPRYMPKCTEKEDGTLECAGPFEDPLVSIHGHSGPNGSISHLDETARATEDLLRALEVIQSPEMQKTMRQQIKALATRTTN